MQDKESQELKNDLSKSSGVLCFFWILGVVPCLFVVIEALVGTIKLKQRFISQLSIPLGQLVISLMLLHSGIMCKLRGGIIWRGTKYSIRDLRAGQRIKF